MKRTRIALVVVAGIVATFSPAEARSPGVPAASSAQVVDEGVTRQARAFEVAQREALGLPTDDATLRTAASETEARLKSRESDPRNPMPAAIPFTNLELDRYYFKNGIPERMRAVEQMIKGSTQALWWRLDLDWSSIGVVLLVTPTSSPDFVKDLLAAVPADIPARIERVDLSSAEWQEAIDRLNKQLGAATDSPDPAGNLFVAARNRGLDIFGFKYHESQPSIVFQFASSPNAAAPEVLEEALAVSGEGERLSKLRIELEQATPPTPSTRDDDPGQIKAGLRINSAAACTSNVLIRRNDYWGVLTAGHCGPAGGVWTHNGLAFGTMNGNWWVNNSEADAGLLQISNGAYGSEYYHQLISNGSFWYHDHDRVSGFFGGTEAIGTNVCHEGATAKTAFGFPATTCGVITSSGSMTFSNVVLLNQTFTTMTTCAGDSGALVRSGNTAYGVLSARAGGDDAGLCAPIGTYSKMARVLAAIGNGANIMTSSGPVQPASYMRVINQSPGKCVDAAGNGTADATIILQWTCNGGWAQNWSLSPVTYSGSDRDYNFRRGNYPTKCLDLNVGVPGGGWNDGTPFHLWSCHGGINQVVTLATTGQPWMTVRTSSYGAKCMDAPGLSDGLQLHTWSCHFGGNQLWRIG